MSFDMSKFCRAIQAGFKISAAKLLSDKEIGWVPMVRAEEVENFLAKHKCELIGDTPEQALLRELVKAVDEGGDSGDLVSIADRAATMLGIPTP